MSNQQPKPTFNVEALMTNAHDGYRQERFDKAKIHRLNCMLDEAHTVRNRLRSEITKFEVELATVQKELSTVQERRLADRQRFIKILLITVLVMTLMLITAVSF